METEQKFEIKNLGYENGWQELPPEVAKCRSLGHNVDIKNIHERCLSVTTCEICNYFFRTDSSG